jgi:iron(III) transport system permease protein
VLLPFAVLLWSSCQKFYCVPSIEALKNLTLDPYRFVISYPNLGRSFGTAWRFPSARRR